MLLARVLAAAVLLVVLVPVVDAGVEPLGILNDAKQTLGDITSNPPVCDDEHGVSFGGDCGGHKPPIPFPQQCVDPSAVDRPLPTICVLPAGPGQ